MKEALTRQLETLYGPYGRTQDPQLDETGSQGNERPDGLTKIGILSHLLQLCSLQILSPHSPKTGWHPVPLNCLGQVAKEQLACPVTSWRKRPFEMTGTKEVTLILKRGGKAGHFQDYQPLAVTNDVVRMAKNRAKLQALLDICTAEMTKLGVCFNTKETKVVPSAGNFAEAADLIAGK
ncbi:hypothetical protein HPB50_008433 [Hyalomma asiaticum]|uniref:Uncharacterized protein n=1 Tax=Hyalomma asiaticum TaxID=266040 RepID=A0ACB7T6P3_HYAAI|nr:hypothetical protein HPB50_008433 [Hyalomma asiaticum]